MGVCYKLICRDCRRELDLVKNGDIDRTWSTKTVPRGNCKDYLWPNTVAFLARHWGHSCDVVSDHAGDEYYQHREPEDVDRPPPIM